jgi:sugar lactone lactonase YvrE
MRRVLVGVVAVFLLASATGASARSNAARLKAALALTPSTALTRETVSASFKGSSVPRGTTLRKVTISWGDGTPPVALHKLTATATHHFAHAGQFTVKATVTDSKGKSVTTTRGEKVVVQDVYWDLFNGASLDYQLEYTKAPLTTKSTDTTITGDGSNGLRCTSGMGIGPQHRLWVISYPSGCSAPSPAEIQVFSLPFKPSSAPLFTLTLPGVGDANNLTFDRKGNAWVEDAYNNTVYEFPAPFTDNTTLVPSLTLVLPNMVPSGLALDANGDLFVANVQSTSTRSIAIYDAPITADSTPTFLNGLTSPGGLAFDKHGDLYASNNPLDGKGAAIVRYDAHQLTAGATPTLMDKVGLKGEPYEANFAWDASGNLYVADCGSVANVRVYPLAAKSFTAKLAPSVTHRNASFDDVECAWGLAIG